MTTTLGRERGEQLPAPPTGGPAGPPEPNGPRRRRSAGDVVTVVRTRFRSAVTAVRSTGPLSQGQIVAVWLMIAISVLALFFALSATWFSGFQEHRSNSLLYAQLRQGLSEETVPTGGLIAPGTPVAVLSIPALGLRDQVIVEGTDSQQTSRAIGHRRDTVLPGQIGTGLLYGRSVTYGGVFSDIADLRPGQKIKVTTAQGSFTYQVERVRRDGDPLPSALSAGGSRLVLATAADPLSGHTSTVFVDSTIVGKAVGAPSGRPSAVSNPEKALGTNTNSLVLLVLWLQAFALSAGLATWASTRWGTWQVWVAGTPVLIGTLWEAVQQVLLLLPNLL